MMKIWNPMDARPTLRGIHELVHSSLNMFEQKNNPAGTTQLRVEAGPKKSMGSMMDRWISIPRVPRVFSR